MTGFMLQQIIFSTRKNNPSLTWGISPGHIFRFQNFFTNMQSKFLVHAYNKSFCCHGKFLFPTPLCPFINPFGLNSSMTVCKGLPSSTKAPGAYKTSSIDSQLTDLAIFLCSCHAKALQGSIGRSLFK